MSICLILCLVNMGGCIVVKDKKAREKQIENAGQNMGQHILWKKIKKAKEAIDQVYVKLSQLQDSIDRAKYNVSTILDLKISSIDEELLDMEMFNSNITLYFGGMENQYLASINNLYNNRDIKSSVDQLTTITNLINIDYSMPTEHSEYEARIKYRNEWQYHFGEYTKKRSLQAAKIYRRWAGIYREKGVELSELVLSDDQFAMTDFERINAQRLSKKYIVLSYEFIEKSDSIILAVGNHGDVTEKQHEQEMRLYLINESLFNN